MSGFVANARSSWARAVDAFEDAVYALAYRSNEAGQLTLQADQLAMIVRGSVDTCLSIASIYRAFPALYPELAPIAPQRRSIQLQLAELIDAVASG